MVFSSHIFLFYFLPFAIALYYLAPTRARHGVLTVLSYLFYGWANPLFTLLMFGSTVVDYFCGRVIAAHQGDDAEQRTRRQRIALMTSIVCNLALLGFFKYFNFGIESYNAVIGSIGLDALQWHTLLNVTLPLGISFYTFQSMSYTIDIYRGEAQPVRSFVDFACYVSMFPQLVAGPIVRFHQIADQLSQRTHSLEKFSLGALFFGLGLAKKVLLANPCGWVADVAFSAGAVSPLDAWYGVVAYAFQIYFDFSGYSDMAIGLGLFFGFQLPKNFDSPYRSQSITEFWRRWHISLSTFLRDNLYIPLGGNRKGPVRTYLNLAIVMLLGGLWHGAAWNFVIWGAIHGIMLGVERGLGKNSLYHRAPKFLRIALTFFITCLAWVFFRAPDLGSALRYLANLFGLGPVQDGTYLVAGSLYQPYYVLMVTLAAAITWGAPTTWEIAERLTWKRALWCTAMLVLAAAVLNTQSFNPFIYFIF